MSRSQDLLILWLFVVIVNISAIESSKVSRLNSTTRPPTALSNRSCSISSFDLCLSKIQEVTKDSKLAFATNRADLELACRKLKDGDTCAHNHMRNCTNKSQKMMFQEIVKGTKQVLKYLCESGDFQNNYLRYSQCFKNVSMSEQKCAPVLRKVQEMSVAKKSSDVEEELKKFCCAFKESFHCQIDFVRRDCGERAVKFFEKYLTEISASLMHQHCSAYTFSDKCDPRIDSLNHSPIIKHSNQLSFMINVFILAFLRFLCFC